MVIYTHGHAEPVLRSHRWRTAANSAAYLLPYLQPGMRLLDVGSGPGTITADLAERVAPGSVTAVEATPQALELTSMEMVRRGLTIELVVGDLHSLDLSDDSFDVVHAHQVLQHVADPVQALREMRRVCRPGGVVAVRDGDFGGFTWWPQLPELDQWLELYRRVARANGGEPDAGRRLLSWAREAGFVDVIPTASTWCFATAEDRTFWGGMWGDRITTSALAEQLLASGLASAQHLQDLADAWRRWAAAGDGWFCVVHSELICQT